MPETAHLFLSVRRKLIQQTGSLHYESIDVPQLNGRLLAFDELVLTPGASYNVTTGKADLLHLLPLVGSVMATIGAANFEINAGQSAVLPLNKAGSSTISNLEPKGEVTVLKALITTPVSQTPEISRVDIDSHMDKLLVPHVAPTIRLGQFKGRQHGKLKFHPPASLFVFVIEGAFEVQGRLLERRDGLALKDFTGIEFESLSDYAMLWMMEA
jgi:hypothetical protein